MNYLLIIIIFTLFFIIIVQDPRVIPNEKNANSRINRRSLNLATNTFNLEWYRIWGGTDCDYFSGLVIDSLGDIYVGGETYSFGAGECDTCIVKYDSLGTKLWNYTWGRDGNDYFGGDMTIDSSDNIYLAGMVDMTMTTDGLMGECDIYLLKYDSSGNLKWNRTWGGSHHEALRAIAIDSLNNIYITGWTYSFGNLTSDIFLVKFNSAGIREWNHTWGGDKDEFPSAITIDSSNNLYIAGETNRLDAEYDFCLIKYNSSGNLIWNRTWVRSGRDMCSTVAVDSLGDIYVGGSTYIVGTANYDACMVKYDNMGNYKWNRTWGGNREEGYRRIIIDSSDYIYLAGFTYNSKESIILLKYNNNGTRLWNTIIDLSDMDTCSGMILDAASNIYLTGNMIDSIDLTSKTFIIVYNNLGAQQHYYTWGGKQHDEAGAITLDSSNNTYVAGLTDSFGSGDPDGYLIKCTREIIIDDGGAGAISFGNYYLIFLIIGMISIAIIHNEILNKRKLKNCDTPAKRSQYPIVTEGSKYIRDS